MNRIVKASLIAFFLVIVIAVAFGAGVAFSNSALAVEAASPAPALVSAPAADAVGETATDSASEPAENPALKQADDGPVDFDTFWEVWNVVHDSFVDREILETENLEYGAIRGLIDALGDEGHTRFMTPQELERQQTDITGKFSGIGAFVGVRVAALVGVRLGMGVAVGWMISI